MEEKKYQVEIVRRWYDFTEVREQRSTHYMYARTLQKYTDSILKQGFRKINETLFTLKACSIEINEDVIENRIRKSFDILKSSFDTEIPCCWYYIKSQLKDSIIEEARILARKGIKTELYKKTEWESTVQISLVPEDELEFIVAE